MNIFLIASIILGITILIAFTRILLGPKTPDRVVGLDTVNQMVIASMILLGVAFEEVIYVDVAIVYALLSFVGTLYIANYLEERAR